MARFYHTFVVGGLFASYFALPGSITAASGCIAGQMQGVYNAEVSNASFQAVLQQLRDTENNSATTTVTGLGDNANSLAGAVPGLGRCYFDGAGNMIGIIAAKGSTPAINTAVGKYTVNTDC